MSVLQEDYCKVYFCDNMRSVCVFGFEFVEIFDEYYFINLCVYILDYLLLNR